MDHRGMTAMITGGGQGIGAAIALELAGKGFSILIADTDGEAGNETAAVINGSGGVCRYVHADVADEVQVKDLTDQAVKAFGRIDILINNAAISKGGSIEEVSMEDWDRVIAVNLRGPFMCAKYCAPVMKAGGGGSIINIASTRALMSEADTFPYSASKGGLLALTHSLAVSLGPFGIRANSICPGWIETGDWRKSTGRTIPVHSEADRLQHPVGRVGSPNDIAKAVSFLCSPDAGFITGANLVIDGGMTVKMIYV